MVAVLLRFFKDPRNDEIALQDFFFFLTAGQEFFFYYICAGCRKFFFEITPPPPSPPQELNGRPLKDGIYLPTSDSEGAPGVEPTLSSTNVPQTLSNLTPLPHQTH